VGSCNSGRPAARACSHGGDIQRAGNGFAPIAIVSAGLLQVVGDVRRHPLNGAKARQARQYRHSIRGRMTYSSKRWRRSFGIDDYLCRDLRLDLPGSAPPRPARPVGHHETRCPPPAFRSTWALGPVAQRHRPFFCCLPRRGQIAVRLSFGPYTVVPAQPGTHDHRPLEYGSPLARGPLRRIATEQSLAPPFTRQRCSPAAP
jgi:hypothetical protein